MISKTNIRVTVKETESCFMLDSKTVCLQNSHIRSNYYF